MAGVNAGDETLTEPRRVMLVGANGEK